jgi:hypothetical protein
MQHTQVDLERQLAASTRRAQQYWHEDGLTELGTGLLFLLIGLLFLLEGSAPAGSPLAHISAPLLPVLVIGGVLSGRWLIRFAKQHITYPRTGYAGLRPERDPRRQRRWAVAIAAGVTGVMTYLVMAAPGTLRWLPFVQGAAVGIILLLPAWRLNLTRYYALALLSTLLGFALLWSPWNDSLTSGMYFGALGLALVATGGWVLVRYLRQPAGEPQ